MQNSKSSLPLVDFISKWRSNNSSVSAAETADRHHSADEVTPNSPLLLNTKYVTSPSSPARSARNGHEHTDVPYPAPESFLPGRIPEPYPHPPDFVSDTDTDSDTDDEAQSIKSYNSDHIRTYDRLSLSRVTSSNSELRDEIIDIPYLDPDDKIRKKSGCFKFTRLCSWTRAKSEESIELQEKFSHSDKLRDSKKNKRSKRTR